MSIIWKYIKQKDLKDDELANIAKLKNEHWQYSIESQILWMKNHLSFEDIHLLGIDEKTSELLAYLALVNVGIKTESKSIFEPYIGLSNVCVKKNLFGKRIGSLLVSQANKWISDNDKRGVLLCKKELVTFYEKNGWKNVSYLEAYVKEEKYDKFIMYYNEKILLDNLYITISRNF